MSKMSKFDDILKARLQLMAEDDFSGGLDIDPEEKEEELRAREEVIARQVAKREARRDKAKKTKAEKAYSEASEAAEEAWAEYGEEEDNGEENGVQFTQEALQQAQIDNYNNPRTKEKIKDRQDTHKINFEKVLQIAHDRKKNELDAFPDEQIYIDKAIEKFNEKYGIDMPLGLSKESILEFLDNATRNALASEETHTSAGITNFIPRDQLGQKNYEELSKIRFPMLQYLIDRPNWTVDEIYKAMVPRVKSLAHRFTSNDRAKSRAEDAFQEGMMGVLHAIRRDKGLSTFAQFAASLAKKHMYRALSKFDTFGRGERMHLRSEVQKRLRYDIKELRAEIEKEGMENGWSQEKISMMQDEAENRLISSEITPIDHATSSAEIKGMEGETGSSIESMAPEEHKTMARAIKMRNKDTGDIIWRLPGGTYAERKIPPGYVVMRDGDSMLKRIMEVGVDIKDEQGKKSIQTFESDEDISTYLRQHKGQTVSPKVIAVLKTIPVNTPYEEVKEALSKAGFAKSELTKGRVRLYTALNSGKQQEKNVATDPIKRPGPTQIVAQKEEHTAEQQEIARILELLKDGDLMGSQALSKEQEFVFKLKMYMETPEDIEEFLRIKKPRATPEEIAEKKDATIRYIEKVDDMSDPEGGEASPEDRVVNAPIRITENVKKIYNFAAGNAATSKVAADNWNKVVFKLLKIGSSMSGKFGKRWEAAFSRTERIGQEYDAAKEELLANNPQLQKRLDAAKGDKKTLGKIHQDIKNKTISTVSHNLQWPVQDIRTILTTRDIITRGAGKKESDLGVQRALGKPIGAKAKKEEFQHIEGFKALQDAKKHRNKIMSLYNDDFSVAEIAELMEILPEHIQAIVRESTRFKRFGKYIPKIHKYIENDADIADIADVLDLSIDEVETLKNLEPGASEEEIKQALTRGLEQDIGTLRSYRGIINQIRDFYSMGLDTRGIANRLKIRPAEVLALKTLPPQSGMSEINKALDAVENIKWREAPEEPETEEPEIRQEGALRYDSLCEVLDNITYQIILDDIENGICDENVVEYIKRNG